MTRTENIARKEKELICIVCPVGCRLKASMEGNDVSVTGNLCPRGEIYGKEEILDPKRVVTATCSLTNSIHTRLPVKSDKPIALEYIDGLIETIYSLSVKAPVKVGDIVIGNYKNTSVNIRASRTVPSQSAPG